MSSVKTAKTLIISGAAALGLAFAAPAAIASDFVDISFDGLDFGEEDFLQKLIEMDADDIADMRAEMADARAEILDAISEIQEARAEAEANPETRTVIEAALAAASAAVTSTTNSAFEKVRAELDEAEIELATTDVSEEEKTETQGAIAAVREELAGIEAAVGELVAAMKA